jgi:hypothetical protein
MNMRLRIGEYEIPERTLTNVDLIVGTSTVVFSGMAQEEEAKEILPKLRELAAELAPISYEAIDVMGTRSTGVCSLINLKLEEVTTTPSLVIFSGELVYPDS